MLESQHEDLKHSLGAGHPLPAALDHALLERPGPGRRGLFLLALGGGLDGAVGCAFAAVDLSVKSSQIFIFCILLLSLVKREGKTYVAALLSDPHLLLDVAVAFAHDRRPGERAFAGPQEAVSGRAQRPDRRNAQARQERRF